ncbi:PrpF domain-containing protein [Streptomyces sp. NPDC090025]|uniref:PrpF domain-containing protein n=1 Tax=Streptomyces sp. NPDC090025 TaxID=3365922 RepID=UPI00383413D5
MRWRDEAARPRPPHALVVRAEDAPGPTLVLRGDQLPPNAVILSRELAELPPPSSPFARTPGKIAVYGPSGHPGADLDYRFVQALPGGRFDFRTGCGHSLLACVVAHGANRPPATARRPLTVRAVTVRAVTTGDLVRCLPEPADESDGEGGDGGDGGDGGAYTVEFLRAPDAPGTLPTGEPVTLLDGVPVTLVRYGNPYVLVDARRTAVTEARLLDLRARAARILGHPPHSPLPKIAAVRRAPDGGLAVRALTVGGWHPRLALTGAAAVAAAGAIAGTVVDGPVAEIRTPQAPVSVSVTGGSVRVHHKRARVTGRLELPWRIHATA